MTRVFVYGSLMRGGRWHAVIAPGRFLGEARTQPAYTLLDLGRYPGLEPGGATAVHGELYEVDDATLDALDELEGHPELYERRPVLLDGEGDAQAWFTPDGASGPVVTSGDWRRR